MSHQVPLDLWRSSRFGTIRDLLSVRCISGTEGSLIDNTVMLRRIEGSLTRHGLDGLFDVHRQHQDEDSNQDEEGDGAAPTSAPTTDAHAEVVMPDGLTYFGYLSRCAWLFEEGAALWPSMAPFARVAKNCEVVEQLPIVLPPLGIMDTIPTTTAFRKLPLVMGVYKTFRQLLSNEGREQTLVVMDKAACERLKEAGNVHYREGRYDDAIKPYSDAVDVCPRDQPGLKAIVLANLGACHIQQGNYDAAIVDCSKSIKHDEQYVKAYYRRCCAYEAQGKWDHALWDMNDVIELDPSQRARLRDRHAMLETRAQEAWNRRFQDEEDMESHAGSVHSIESQPGGSDISALDYNTADRYRLGDTAFHIIPYGHLPDDHPYKASYSTSDPVIRHTTMLYPSFTIFAMISTLPLFDSPQHKEVTGYDGALNDKFVALATQPIGIGDYLTMEHMMDWGDLDNFRPAGRSFSLYRYVIVHGHRHGDTIVAFGNVWTMHSGLGPDAHFVRAALYHKEDTPENGARIPSEVRKSCLDHWGAVLHHFGIK
ncbi:unnamed protein product [Vitrella brassicaformis CCMP3155]|uniref:Uncharacterized protein n=3 Tax=Vitrella brassicaformis TaxID=1169539 RepID=A0A0G4EY95_VITBC|nr:unnamed protein product [Vitrella brassicaformis CCMP3155]|eukprot:CEM04105.1 unnamed protein product [Vitrella brassicaformis CCMP3155]